MNKREIEKLIERYRANHDMGAFENLFAPCSNLVWAFILSKRIQRDEAEVLFQEISQAIANVLKDRNPSHFMGLIFTIAQGHIAAYDRKYRQRTSHPRVPVEEISTNHSDPEEPELQQWEALVRCRRVLLKSGLTEEQQEVFVLHYGWEIDVKEIAVLRKVSPDTVKNSLYHGKKKINQFLIGGSRSKAEPLDEDGVHAFMQCWGRALRASLPPVPELKLPQDDPPA